LAILSSIKKGDRMTEESSFSLPIDADNLTVRKTVCEPPTYEECIEQSTCPSNFDPRDLGKRILKGYTMIIKKGTNRIVLLKFLLGKLKYSKEGLFIEEYLLLFHLFYELTEITDPLFVQKYQENLFEIQILLNELSKVKIFPIHLSNRGVNEITRTLKLIPTAREFFGLTGQRDLRNCFRLVLHDTIVPKRPPPKRFIGVGYKDKGTCRDPAFDGSPGWQFYAKYFANKEREAEELDSSISDISEFD
jgi:hypothetical protein